MNESSDDFYTYGAVPVQETYVGCGGEFCPGPYDATNPRRPDDPPECGKCARRTKSTVTVYCPIGME